MLTNQKRWCSALDKRLTNNDEQRRTNHFSVRSLCILHVFTWCDRARPAGYSKNCMSDISSLKTLETLFLFTYCLLGFILCIGMQIFFCFILSVYFMNDFTLNKIKIECCLVGVNHNVRSSAKHIQFSTDRENR